MLANKCVTNAFHSNYERVKDLVADMKGPSDAVCLTVKLHKHGGNKRIKLLQKAVNIRFA